MDSLHCRWRSSRTVFAVLALGYYAVLMLIDIPTMGTVVFGVYRACGMAVGVFVASGGGAVTLHTDVTFLFERSNKVDVWWYAHNVQSATLLHVICSLVYLQQYLVFIGTLTPSPGHLPSGHLLSGVSCRHCFAIPALRRLESARECEFRKWPDYR